MQENYNRKQAAIYSNLTGALPIPFEQSEAPLPLKENFAFLRLNAHKDLLRITRYLFGKQHKKRVFGKLVFKEESDTSEVTAILGKNKTKRTSGGFEQT